MMKVISLQFSYWLQRSVIDADNFEERIATLMRALDLLLAFYDLHNFAGIIEVLSALESSAVYRLEHTFNLALRVQTYSVA